MVISLEVEDEEEVTLDDLLTVHVQGTMTMIAMTDQIVPLLERYVRDPDLVTTIRFLKGLEWRDLDLEIVIIQTDVLYILMVHDLNTHQVISGQLMRRKAHLLRKYLLNTYLHFQFQRRQEVEVTVGWNPRLK